MINEKKKKNLEGWSSLLTMKKKERKKKNLEGWSSL